MKVYKGSVLLGVLLAVSLLGGCSSKTETIDMTGMGDITVCAREEGSGTRAEFERLLQITKEADQVLSSTDEMIEAVAKDKNAIGYAAYHSALEKDGVKVVAVQGVQPKDTFIQNNKYPLSREFSLSYQEELSDAASDFLTYVMSAGQGIVSQYAVPMKEKATFLSNRAKGEVSIIGSSSVADMMQALAKDYQTYNDGVKVTVTVTDSSDGITKAMQKQCDFGMSSRALKEYEAQLLKTKVVARDGIAVIVNKDNPLSDISKAQLKDIYDKKLKAWTEWNEK